MVTISFAPVSVNSNEINIDNIGNFAICGKDVLGREFYMIVQTESGITRMLTYGPALMEVPFSPVKTKMSFETILYDSKKIISATSRFLLSNNCVEAEAHESSEILNFTLSSIGGLIR